MLVEMLCMMWMWQVEVVFKGTEVFQPLEKREVKVIEDGGLLILSFADAKIHVYDKNGVKKTSIGGKGTGPGQFTYPTQFWCSNSKIYVIDIASNKLSQFTVDGKFVSHNEIPKRGISIEKVIDGWVYGEWSSYVPTPDGKSLFWVDENWKNPLRLTAVDDPGYGGGAKVIHESGETKAQFSAVGNRPIMLVSADGKTLYLSDTQKFEIQVLDILAKKVKTRIRRNEKPLPYDKTWGNGKFLEFIETQRDAGFKWTKVEPEKFPPIRSLEWSQQGHLLVNLWRGNPDKNDHYLTLTAEGKELKRTWNPELLKRVVGSFGNDLYLLTWNQEEEEAQVVKVSKDRAEAYLKSHPIAFEGEATRSMTLGK